MTAAAINTAGYPTAAHSRPPNTGTIIKETSETLGQLEYIAVEYRCINACPDNCQQLYHRKPPF